MRKHGRPSGAHALGFLLIARLLLILKGYRGTYEVKNCSPCNFRGIAYFTNFFDVLLLSYKLSNFAQAILPYAVG